MTRDPALEAFCAFFNKLDKTCTKKLYMFYTDNAVFIDPLQRIEGREALEAYFSSLYENVTSCQFDFHHQQRQGNTAFVTWRMRLVHPRLDGGREIAVEGCSQLDFAANDTARVARHRDYFDVGAMVYERLPLLGGAVKLVKERLGH
ncbi:nuclear transport factor 2 family protein [Halomonas sp. C05BenzN]|uniref:nuclear transport factor 2 family protein n=1 Tax=Halomonas sp. C05BenzN TaxID=3411041 RepID=UPI003B93439C